MPYYFLTLALVLQLLPGFILSVSRAQGTPPPEGLAIGQAVPSDLVLEMVNYHAPTARLSDFKGKLLILDFWATWCGNCKAAMPKLDAIQKEFGDQVQVLLVNSTSTRDTEEKVKAYFERWRNQDGSRFGLASVVNDTGLSTLFPHRLIPHVVWISPDGIVKATTSADQVTRENIRKMLAQENAHLAQKKDIDMTRPLFSGEELPAGNMLHYAILLKGWVEGVPSGNRLRRSGDIVNGAALTNTPLLTMYQVAKRALYPELGAKGIVLAVQDSARLLREKSNLPPDKWARENAYSYDLVVPAEKADALFRFMLDDLNKYSGYHAALEPREQECLLLVRKGRHDKLKTKGGKPENSLFNKEAPSLRNMPLTALVGRLNSSSLPHLVVDQTGYTGNVDISLDPAANDLASLRRELQKYGLDLVQKKYKADVLVLREN